MKFFLILMLLCLSYSSYGKKNLRGVEKNKEFCRIGMSTQMEKRVKDWTRKYKKFNISLKSHKILKVFNTKKEAQSYETAQAKKQNCIAHPGGRGPQKAKWTVYRLNLKKIGV